MTAKVEGPVGDGSVEKVSLEDAFLNLPDESNPSIIDARETFRITVISAVLFIAAVYIFVL